MESNDSGRTFHVIILFTFLAIYLNKNAYAQVWTDFNEHDPGIVLLESKIPSFDDFFNAESPSSAFEIYTRYKAGDRVSVIASIPVSHFEAASRIGDGIIKTAIGNPYIGARVQGHSPYVSVEAGLRLPVAPSDNSGLTTGILIESHSIGRYLPDVTTISGAFRLYRPYKSGIILRIAGGPDLLIPDAGSTELFFNYFAHLLYRVKSLTVGGGFAGSILASEGDVTFGERSLNDIGIMGSYHFGKFRAGSYLRFPLDDEVNDLLNFVWGLHLGVVI